MIFIFLKGWLKMKKNKTKTKKKWQKLNDPQGMKYLLPGSLQNKFADPCYQILNTLKHIARASF